MSILPRFFVNTSTKSPVSSGSSSEKSSGDVPQSKRLIVVRAGDRSLHRDWLLSSRTDRYDVVVSYYGDGEYMPTAGESVHYFKGGKLEGVFDLFKKRTDLLENYSHIWLPDDDLATNADDIDKLFETAETHNIQICQPSLSWKSYYSYFVTLNNKRFVLRYTDFVEMMAPLFTSCALRRALPLFESLRFGWGADEIWCRLLPTPEFGSAIIDAMTVDHLRPLQSGGLYNVARSPMQERIETLQRAGVSCAPFRPKVYAGIVGKNGQFASGVRLWYHLYSGWKGLSAYPAATIRLRPGKILRFVKKCVSGKPDLTPMTINTPNAELFMPVKSPE